jgi:hypothetical protein
VKKYDQIDAFYLFNFFVPNKNPAVFCTTENCMVKCVGLVPQEVAGKAGFPVNDILSIPVCASR